MKISIIWIFIVLNQVIITYFNQDNTKNTTNTTILAKTTIQVTKTKIDIGIIHLDSIWKGKINIKNTGINNLIIYKVQTSCGCVTATALNRIVPVDSIGSLEIKVKPKGEGFFIQKIGIVCNIEKSPIIFSIKGIIKK